MTIINGSKIKFGDPGWTGAYARKAVADLSNPKALAPVILLETSVLTGRCYHAKERGGWVELRERLLEETLTAAVWFFGITTLNNIGDAIAKRFGLNTKIDVGSDKIPDEFGKLKNHMKGPLQRFTDGKSKTFKNTLTKVKFAKIVLSTLTGIYVVGNIIPRFKNSVTANAKAHPEENSIKAAMLDVFFRGKSSKSIPQNAQNNNDTLEKLHKSTKNTELKFKGSLASLSHKLETDNIYKMLTVDTGIVTGRASNARNDDEKIEIVVRDVGSLYFYMASTHHVANFLANGLNIDDRMGISTKLDPRIAEELDQNIIKQLDDKSKSGSMSKEEFNKFMTQIFGKENSELVKNLKEQSAKTDHTMNLDEFLNRTKHAENFKFIKANAQTAARLNNQVITGSGIMRISRNLEELIQAKERKDNELFKFFSDESGRIYKNTSKGAIDQAFNKDKTLKMIDKFIALDIPVNKEELQKLHKNEIKEAIKLKEHIKQVKPDGNFIVTAQIDDIVHDGLIRDQGFLKKALSISTPESEDPRKYVSLKSYVSTKANIQAYADCLKTRMEQKFRDKDVISSAEFKEELGKFKNRTLKMKALYISAGLGVSAYFLSTVIPELQQYITEKRTGYKGFPGAKNINTTNTCNKRA